MRRREFAIEEDKENEIKTFFTEMTFGLDEATITLMKQFCTHHHKE